MSQTHPSQDTQPGRSLWRNRDFLLLWSGQSVSTLGTGISTFALPLLALALTHSPALAGSLAAVRQAPYLLFSLPAGALVDRWDRKRVMIFCDVGRWLALGSVPLAFALGHLTLAQLYVVGFAEGTAYVFFSLAQIAALPQVVVPAHLSRAYALDNANEYVGALLGPALGAFLIGLAPAIELGSMLAYLADSVSYLFSVVSLRFMRVSFQKERARACGGGRAAVSQRSLWAEIAEGLRFLWGQRRLRLMVLLTTIINFLQSPVTLAVIVLAGRELHLDVQTLGLVVSAGGVGGALGALMAPWLRGRLRFGQIIIGSVLLWSAAALALMAAPSAVVLAVGSGLVSLLWPVYGVTLVSYRLEVTPDALQGRVNSAFRFLSYGSEPLGAALGGALLTALGPRPVLGLIAGGLALSGLVALGTELRKG
ncbi:MAG TPA: MFS transporter [Ktedonobacterales bacterium]|jgi:MFS family permease